jgi:hypothetical protein
MSGSILFVSCVGSGLATGLILPTVCNIQISELILNRNNAESLIYNQYFIIFRSEFFKLHVKISHP